MYMVRFTDGNTIWGRKMKNPAEFAGEPVCQFASLPDTWETMDNRVAEGPWVMKYRDRYYMMYNANTPLQSGAIISWELPRQTLLRFSKW